MKYFLRELRASALATLALAVICCLAYPLAVWIPSQILFNGKANGSLIEKDGKVLGSRLIGQGFAAAKYFHPRPSAAGLGYDGLNSGGSNLGPTSQKLMDSVRQNVEAFRKENGLGEDVPVPADAVTASASGLDPHISPRNAALQVARVVQARGLDLREVEALVARHTEFKDMGFLGEDRVNVLELNLDLDALANPGRN